MFDPRPAPRRYSDEDVRKLLERAAELQHTEPGGSGSTGLTLHELETIARQAGIDPAAVRRAADEMELGLAPASNTIVGRLAGAPTRLVLERALAGEVEPSTMEAAIPIIQATADTSGQASLVGRTLTWQAQGPNAARDLQVMITSRDGETRIRIEERYGNLTLGLFGVVIGVGAGAGFGVGLGVGAAIGSALMMLAVPVAALGLSYGGARAIYGSIIDRRRRALQRLLSDLSTALVAERAAEERAIEGGGPEDDSTTAPT